MSALVLWKFPGVWVLVLIVCANILSVAMTYSAGGRFMVPVQPLLAALVAAAVVYAPASGLDVAARQLGGEPARIGLMIEEPSVGRFDSRA